MTDATKRTAPQIPVDTAIAQQTNLFTVREAAFVAGTTPQTVRRTIDRGEIASETAECGGVWQRCVGLPEALYLRIRPVLSGRARRSLYGEIRGRTPDRLPRRLEAGDIVLDLGPAIDRLLRRCIRLRRVWESVEILPRLYAGEPFLRHTRIPVHLVAKKVGRDRELAQLRERFPFLTDSDVETCRIYAELYPRPGPSRRRWGMWISSDMAFHRR